MFESDLLMHELMERLVVAFDPMVDVPGDPTD